MTGTAVLAHAGGFGWDEALFLLLPVVVLVVLGWQAKRKAEEAEAEEARASESTD